MKRESWNEGLKCHVVRLAYDFVSRVGRLDMAAGDCCDMSGCIRLFQQIDPAAQVVRTYSGDTPNTRYEELRGEWYAFPYGEERAT